MNLNLPLQKAFLIDYIDKLPVLLNTNEGYNYTI